MRFNRIVLIAIFMFAIITVGAVSAADINETSDDSIGVEESSVVAVESSGDDILSSAGDEILADGEKSFDDIQTLIDGASEDETIVLSGNYLGEGSKITIDKPITIDGNNSTLDAKGASGIFKVDASNVVIKNINFINGNYASAIWWGGNCGSVVNCSFVNCFSGDWGGAIRWNADHGSVVGCSFVDCSANDYGGVIYWIGNHGSVFGCSFVNGYASYGGGAIYWEGDNVTFFNCSFVNCSSYGYGGAIDGTGGGSLIDNFTFSGNSTSSGNSTMLTLSGCTAFDCIFTGNSAENGGAIYNVNAVRCTFTANHADQRGGAMHGGTAVYCIFANNTAGLEGDDTYDTTIIDHGDFSISAPASVSVNSTRGVTVPLIVIDGVDAISFDKDDISVAIGNIDGNGTAMVDVDSFDVADGILSFTLDDAGFTNATLAIWYGNQTSVNVTLNRVYNAEIRVLNTVSQYMNGNFTFQLFDVDANSTISGKRVALYTSGNIRTGFTAKTDENGIAQFVTSNLYRIDMVDMSLNMNHLEVGNQMVEISTPENVNSTKLTINLTVVKADINIAVDDFEDYCGTDRNVTINVTYALGGAPATDTVLLLRINGTNYYGQTDSNGQVNVSVRKLYAGSYHLSVSNNDTRNINSVEENAIITLISVNGTSGNSTPGGIGSFEELQNEINNASTTLVLARDYLGNGSMITVSKDNFVIDAQGYTLDANDMSGIFEITGNNVTLINANMINANSFDYVISWMGVNGRMIGCDVRYSSGRNQSGSIYWRGADGVVANSSFANCSAQFGGAICWEAAGGAIENCSFANCSSVSGGGAIDWCGADGTLKGCSFEECSAGRGGAIRWESADGSVLNCSFVDCYAGQNGGAIYWDAANCLILNCSFVECSSEDFGAAIDWEGDADGSVSGCSFVECSCEYDAVICWGGGSIANCSFADCWGGHAINCWGGDAISDCSFANCSFSMSGGSAIHFTAADGSVAGCDFVNCSGSQVIQWDSDNGSIRNCIFENCSLNSRTISLIGDDIEVSNCSFVNCFGDYNGGAIECRADNCTVFNCSFVGCCASNNGGAIYWDGADGSVFNCSFERCSAKYGGAIYWDGADGSVLNCSFINCSAEIEGDAIYWAGNGGKVENSTFDLADGGDSHAIYSNSNLTVSDSGFAGGDAQSLDDVIQGATVLKCNLNGSAVGNATAEIEVIISDIEAGQSQIVGVVLAGDATGQIRFNLFAGNTLVANASARLADGAAQYEFPNLAFGVYSLDIHYSGDEKYAQTSISAEFAVRPKVNLSQDAIVGETVDISVDLANSTGYLKVFVDGSEVASKLFKNLFQTTLPTELLSYGNHTVTFEYSGSSFDANVFNYFDEVQNRYLPFAYNMTLSPIVVDVSDEYDSNDEGILMLTFDEGVTGNVEIDVVDEFTGEVRRFVVEIVDGIARVDMSEFKDGNYKITFKYLGDEKHAPIIKQSVANVRSSVPGMILSSDVSMTYSSGRTFSAIVLTKSGKPLNGVLVSFSANGKALGSAITNGDGVAGIVISLAPGTYRVTSSASGVSAANTLKVNHLVSLKKVAVKKSAKKLVLSASLAKVNGKFLKGKKITFKFNGKKYTAKTNKKGVAKATVKSSVLKKLKVGKKVTCQATYLKDTVKYSVKIKK